MSIIQGSTYFNTTTPLNFTPTLVCPLQAPSLKPLWEGFGIKKSDNYVSLPLPISTEFVAGEDYKYIDGILGGMHIFRLSGDMSTSLTASIKTSYLPTEITLLGNLADKKDLTLQFTMEDGKRCSAYLGDIFQVPGSTTLSCQSSFPMPEALRGVAKIEYKVSEFEGQPVLNVFLQIFLLWQPIWF